MLLRRGSFGLSLLVVLTTASGAASCRNKASDSLDAASDAAASNDATTADASSAATDSGSIGSSAAAATAVATPAVPILPRPTPFSGSYRCFKGGMQLEQAGNIVTSTMHKDSTTDTILACTAIGDVCTGTLRDIHLVRSKSKKVGNVRPVTLLRTAAGDVIVKLESEQKPDQRPSGAKSSSSSKAAVGDQTFCPRR